MASATETNLVGVEAGSRNLGLWLAPLTGNLPRYTPISYTLPANWN
jgi:hypothetical protein